LRDIGALLDFSVEWTDGRVVIDTSTGYTSPTGSIANYFTPRPTVEQDMNTGTMFRFGGTEDNVIVEYSLDGGLTWAHGTPDKVIIPDTNNLPLEYIVEQMQIWIDAGRNIPDWLMDIYNSL
jgi:hypothetical protein